MSKTVHQITIQTTDQEIQNGYQRYVENRLKQSGYIHADQLINEYCETIPKQLAELIIPPFRKEAGWALHDTISEQQIESGEYIPVTEAFFKLKNKVDANDNPKVYVHERNSVPVGVVLAKEYPRLAENKAEKKVQYNLAHFIGAMRYLKKISQIPGVSIEDMVANIVSHFSKSDPELCALLKETLPLMIPKLRDEESDQTSIEDPEGD